MSFYTDTTLSFFQPNLSFLDSLLDSISKNFAIICVMSIRIMVLTVPFLLKFFSPRNPMISSQLNLPFLRQITKDFVGLLMSKLNFPFSSSIDLFLAHGIYSKYFHTQSTATTSSLSTSSSLSSTNSGSDS